jgi:hypothetical protein
MIVCPETLIYSCTKGGIMRSWLFSAVLMIATIVAPGGLWGTVTVNTGSVKYTLAENYHGVNMVAYWEQNGNERSPGSSVALTNANVQLIRFPGGVPGNSYDWANPFKNCQTNTDQLWAWAQPTGGKLLIETNHHLPCSKAAAWATYCLGKNIPVPLWEVGNEPDLEVNLQGVWGNITGIRTALKAYFDSANAQLPLIHASYPGSIVMFQGGMNESYWNPPTQAAGWGCGMLQATMASCPNAEAISLHWYLGNGGNNGWNGMKSVAQDWPAKMANIRAQCPTKPIYITEWSCLGPGFGDIGSYQTAIGLALANADVIGQFCELGIAGHTMFGAHHRIDGNWGILGVDANDFRGADEPSPLYFVIPLWTKMGNMVCATTNTENARTTLSAYGHKKADGSVQVMLINKTAAPINEVIAFQGYDPTGKSVGVFELKPQMTLPAIGHWAVSRQAAPHMVSISDPVAGAHYVLNPAKKTARKFTPPANAQGSWRKSRGASGFATQRQAETMTVSLGTQTINGVSAEGTRYTRTIPAGAIGNQNAIQIVTERWYSAELQTYVMTKRTDPREGTTITQLTNIQRQEPDASLFTVPPDYTVKEGEARRGFHGAAQPMQ